MGLTIRWLRIPASATFLFLDLAVTNVLNGQSAGPPETNDGGSRETVPIETSFRVARGNLLTARATIGGVKDLNVVFDLGTSPSIISRDIANRLKLPRKQEPLETLTGRVQVPSVTVPDIQLGAMHTGSRRVLVEDFTGMNQSAGMSVSAILGLDVLCAHPFTMDFHRKKLIFGVATPLRNAAPLATTKPFLTVRATVNGQTVRLLLDLGPFDFLLFRGRLKPSPKSFHFYQASAVYFTGRYMQVKWLRSAVWLGENDLGVHEIAVADIDPDPDIDGLLGLSMLGFRRISFDLEKHLFRWE